MSLNGGLGAVVTRDSAIGTFRVADCVQAVKHGNGRDWWVIAKYSNINSTVHNRFYVYLVTPNGISAPTIYNKGSATDVDFQKIVFNSSGTKFMLINTLGFMCEYDFNRCTGNITNPNIIILNRLWVIPASLMKGPILQMTVSFMSLHSEIGDYPNVMCFNII